MPGNYLRHIGLVSPVCETSAVAAGDIICDTTAIPNACSAIDQPTYFVKVMVYDQDDNTPADLRIVFLANSTSLGTLNSTPSISDANGLDIIGDVLIASADWHDLGGFKWVEIPKEKLPEAIHPKTGTNSVYFAVLAGGATTSTVSGLKFRFYAQDVYPY